MANEDRVAFESDLRPFLRADTDKLVAPFQIDTLARDGARERRVRRRLHAYQRNALVIRAFIAGRLGARQGELRRDVFGRDLPSAQSNPAPFQEIARQKPGMFADPLGGNGSVLRRKRKRNGKQRYRPHADIVAPAFRATARRGRWSRFPTEDPSSRRRSWLRQNTARKKASG